MRTCGIDPGKGGAVAVIEDGRLFEVRDCPTLKGKATKRLFDEQGMVEMIREMQPDRVNIEHVHAMPGQGVTSMFSMGQGYGLWIGILAAMRIPFRCVAPQTWQKQLLKDIPGDGKQRAATACMRLLPDSRKWVLGPRGGVLDGRADAICLAMFE